MYAVIESGGKQHRVEPGEVLQLEKLDVAEGDNAVTFDVPVLAETGETFARFRLSSVGNLSPADINEVNGWLSD